jgi:hypothetical protein
MLGFHLAHMPNLGACFVCSPHVVHLSKCRNANTDRAAAADCTTDGAKRLHGRWNNPLAGTVRICTATIGPHKIKTRKGKTEHHDDDDDQGALLPVL